MTDICEICRLPVLDGEPVHGATGNHWDCQKSADRAKYARKAAAVAEPEPEHVDFRPPSKRDPYPDPTEIEL